MTQMPTLTDPWLVAVWPGMGRVARTAGEYLAAALDMEHVGDFPADRFFEMTHVAVEEGIAQPAPRPRCPLFIWRDPNQRHDLVLMLGEAQPPSRGIELCEEVAKEAKQWGVSRVLAFAAMATQMHPSDNARVFGAATHEPVLEELNLLDVEPLDGGQIGGLNGLMLLAAKDQGLAGACLLGELPYFATQVPNPKASRVVLGVLTDLLNIQIDFTQLDEQAQQVDVQLTQLVEQLQRRAQEEAEMGEEEESEFSLPGAAAEEGPTTRQPTLPPQVRQRIEALFQEAREDRGKAYQLKRELDRHNVFKEYEDRFLDLFRRGE